MANTCYNCGTENAEVEKFCHKCGATLGSLSDLQKSAIQGGRGPERLLWDNGELQLTTDAVLIGMTGDAPDVVPLETIYDIVLEERCVVLKVKDGDDKYCMVDDPTEFADLVRDHMFRPRLAHERKDMGYIPPD